MRYSWGFFFFLRTSHRSFLSSYPPRTYLASHQATDPGVPGGVGRGHGPRGRAGPERAVLEHEEQGPEGVQVLGGQRGEAERRLGLAAAQQAAQGARAEVCEGRARFPHVVERGVHRAQAVDEAGENCHQEVRVYVLRNYYMLLYLTLQPYQNYGIDSWISSTISSINLPSYGHLRYLMNTPSSCLIFFCLLLQVIS